MSLQPQTIYQYGIRTIVTTSYDPSSGQTSSSEQYASVPANFKSLPTFVSNKGNFILPTEQSFISVTRTGLLGHNIETKRYASGYWVRKETLGPSGQLANGASPRSGQKDLVYNAALSELIDKVRGELDLGMMAATAGQTKGLLKSSGKFLEYVLGHPTHNLKKFFKEWERSPKRIGSRWLEFQYGARPFMSDLFHAVEKIFESTQNIMEVKTRASETLDWSDRFGDEEDGLTVYKNKQSNRCEIQVAFQLGGKTLPLLAQYSSLNPLSIAWELVPYSFVADWFYDVGGYLRAFESAVAYNSAFLSGYVTQLERVETGYKEIREFDDGFLTTSKFLEGSFKHQEKTRHVLGSMPFPRPPVFKADLGAGRLLNAAALMSQHLR